MTSSAQVGPEVTRREGYRTRPSPNVHDDSWRLLVRIAQVRWVAFALGVAYALFGRHPSASPVLLLVLAAMAATYNAVVTWHERVPRAPAAMTMTLITVIGDFIWLTGAETLLGSTHGGMSLGIGYIVVGAEAGLLLGWRGALAAIVFGAAAVATLDSTVVHGADNTSLADIFYQAATITVSAVFAAVGSAELHVQRRQLASTTAVLAKHARTDPLTGLGNALSVWEGLSRVARAVYGLLLIDVDGMHWTNSVYGHQAGDEMLLGVARVLHDLRDPGDHAARMGEDKFVLLVAGAEASRLTSLAEEVRVAMHGVAVSGGHLRVSVGCAWSVGGEDPSVTLTRADDALQAAKAAGGDRVIVQTTAEGRGPWRLRESVQAVLESERGVYTVFQRIVRLSDRSVIGWEALSRPHEWPANSDVEALFLTAHRMGRGRDLDWRCRRNALWSASRIGGLLFVNINVSGLVDPVHGVDQMLLLCDWARRAPNTVVLELSERDAMPDMSRLRSVLADYRAAGFRFALDDLGEGQTTLELVLAARPEFLKLARPLLRASSTDLSSRSAARALVTFAHDIDALVIAEGMEDERDAELCRTLHVDYGQGWLFGRPLPAEQLPS